MTELTTFEAALGGPIKAIEFPSLLADSCRGIYGIPNMVDEYRDLLVLLGVSKETLKSLEDPEDDWSYEWAVSELENACLEVNGRLYYLLFRDGNVYLTHDGLRDGDIADEYDDYYCEDDKD
jgi:hypothetical protein